MQPASRIEGPECSGGALVLLRAQPRRIEGQLVQVLGGAPRVGHQPGEQGGLVGEQLIGRRVLGERPGVKEHDLRGVHDRVQPVRNGKHGRGGEGVADGALQQTVGLIVDGRGRLVEGDEPRAAEGGAGEADQLALPRRELPERDIDGALYTHTWRIQAWKGRELESESRAHVGATFAHVVC
jgi:hypothetical protein